MHSTTTIEGTTARITPHGVIDFTTLPGLRASRAALPSEITAVTWDLRDIVFMDVAGLHLLTEHLSENGHPRRWIVAVAGLAAQPERLLRMAAEAFPAMGFGRLLTGPPREQVS
ncbi:STAS domain-containing protein [Streptomyces sp. NPDC047097]|uniref:STAS domain-containing protein n=1 Tax=Streptomyces sp. NPDC047097 TaxID=3155260 RepID=UPI0033CDDD9C